MGSANENTGRRGPIKRGGCRARATGTISLSGLSSASQSFGRSSAPLEISSCGTMKMHIAPSRGLRKAILSACYGCSSAQCEQRAHPPSWDGHPQGSRFSARCRSCRSMPLVSVRIDHVVRRLPLFRTRKTNRQRQVPTTASRAELLLRVAHRRLVRTLQAYPHEMAGPPHPDVALVERDVGDAPAPA